MTDDIHTDGQTDRTRCLAQFSPSAMPLKNKQMWHPDGRNDIQLFIGIRRISNWPLVGPLPFSHLLLTRWRADRKKRSLINRFEDGRTSWLFILIGLLGRVGT